MSLPGILIFWLSKTRGLAMLSRGFCDWEKSKVLVKSGSENLKPIRDGYTLSAEVGVPIFTAFVVSGIWLSGTGEYICAKAQMSKWHKRRHGCRCSHFVEIVQGTWQLFLFVRLDVFLRLLFRKPMVFTLQPGQVGLVLNFQDFILQDPNRGFHFHFVTYLVFQ